MLFKIEHCTTASIQVSALYHFPLGLVVKPTHAKWNHSMEHWGGIHNDIEHEKLCQDTFQKTRELLSKTVQRGGGSLKYSICENIWHYNF